ncbi:hypothetical protein TNCV_3854971 [Trichonephila clavipes]|nr:hypothetical protein TNCV_3854971 [Trichonephila clavipes]
MVSITFVFDIKVLNFLNSKNRDADIRWIASCFPCHNDESWMPKFREQCANRYAQPNRIFLHGRYEEMDETIVQMCSC